MPVLPGYKLWEWTTPLTQAASPLLSAWFDTTGYTTLLPFMISAGGTTVYGIDGSFDGTNADADFAYAAPTSGTPVTILSPYIRFKVTQTVADATKTKIFLQARA
jgi:hypothetical protein